MYGKYRHMMISIYIYLYEYVQYVYMHIYICTSGTSRYHISNYIGDVMRIELDIHGIPPTSWAG